MYLNIQKISVNLKYYDATIHRTLKVMLISNRIYTVMDTKSGVRDKKYLAIDVST